MSLSIAAYLQTQSERHGDIQAHSQQMRTRPSLHVILEEEDKRHFLLEFSSLNANVTACVLFLNQRGIRTNPGRWAINVDVAEELWIAPWIVFAYSGMQQEKLALGHSA